MNLNKYKINRLDNDELKPEETLADVLSIHSAVESPIGRRVFSVFYLFVLGAFSLVAMKAFQLQIVDGKDYAVSAEQGSTSSFQLTPLRGIIYDSNNQPMVENAAIFDVVAVHRYLPSVKTEIDKVVEALAGLADINRDGLAKLFEENSNAASFAIKRNVSKEEAIKIENLSLPGVYVVANSQRHHIGGAATAHLLGYTAHVAPGDIEFDDYYFINDRIGRLGIEAQYEYELRGQHRAIDFGSGEITKFEEVTPGNSVFLNIDFTMQKKLYETLAFVFASSGVKRGAAIIQNPKTGAVLAIASMPAFDPNVFENSSLPENAARISNLLVSPDRPLLNRVVSGRYSPGSTIKPLLALAGLKEGVVTPSTIIFADGGISVRSEVDYNTFFTFKDWKVHGWTDIKKAISDSVDVYFYALGGGYGPIKEGLGIDRISRYLKGAGADKLTGIDLPGEIAGLVPSKEWKKEVKGEAWYAGDTYNISIGQGDLGVTPTWLNAYVGAIANGGKLMKPRIVKEVKNYDGVLVAEFKSQATGELPFDQNTLDIVRQGMRQTILSGTAKLLQDVPVALAAKTGTAQITGRGLNSLFTVFGPYDDPEIVMTVLVENINESQGLAIRVANDFLLWYFTVRNANQ
ncbi:MAG: hypothetical protein A2831_01645 [Candidatus Yanofskybacteria bacterium RIFCSPHIGHO2_01_FULL_44_17]|uniref:Penicillin-binding protein 2 n=1 Tax=Candidatus Yanofskybacteria bacterium RIFCSPHIGHO2_01_FULL_44_17 TaxID=1802668 RepID=A0A1F8EXG8_9BACT|nr:MAG: hypothetical protein A2831_01645 [Candidatus Yanofskybacteria bacterium RIFCSPHIGHO2_01_FULL_44_17]